MAKKKPELFTPDSIDPLCAEKFLGFAVADDIKEEAMKRACAYADWCNQYGIPCMVYTCLGAHAPNDLKDHLIMNTPKEMPDPVAWRLLMNAALFMYGSMNQVAHIADKTFRTGVRSLIAYLFTNNPAATDEMLAMTDRKKVQTMLALFAERSKNSQP